VPASILRRVNVVMGRPPEASVVLPHLIGLLALALRLSIVKNWIVI
jgi:hypothetical protein